jgi:hypothetical protein
MMQSDKNKTKDELIRELKALKSQFNERTASFEQECFEPGDHRQQPGNSVSTDGRQRAKTGVCIR